MEKILSIIIPTYNMEALLPRCLDSLIINEKKDFLEVWVVNDGSKDSSSKIAHEYESKYPEIFNVIDKPNGNYGSCINVALPLCTGKYVKVLDSDDYFDTQNLMKMILVMENVDVDVFFTNFRTFGIEEKLNCIEKLKKNTKISCDDFQSDFICMHSVAYCTNLLRNIKYVQTEGISYTDTEWVYYPFFAAQSMYYMDIPVYMYYVGREGQTMDPKVLTRQVKHLKIILMRMISFYANTDKIRLSVGVSDYINYRIWILLNDVYSRYLVTKPSKEKIKEIFEVDKSLKDIDLSLYNAIGAKGIPFARIRYYFIKMLRNKRHGTLLILSQLYDAIRNIR